MSVKFWIQHVSDNYGYSIQNLNYIFCDDAYLLQINQKHLGHDTFTDIITFDYSSGKSIESEIYISCERILENSVIHSVSFKDELHRVMIHGVLHLCGFKDKNPVQKSEMTDAENYCLTLRAF